ncbi:MAG: cytochrome b N-terminal domain-containing protein [Desulfovibrionaceae bacterium]
MMNIRTMIGWESHLKPFLYKRLPDRTGWSAVLGTLCALTFIIMVCTGIILAFFYVPSPDKAWDSVKYITNDVPAGSILRGLHHWGAGAMVLLVFIHQLVSYFHGSYVQPRQLTWVTGALLFLVTLGLGFTGYLLPWDMKAYWATIVGANIPHQYPVVGETITRIILGGDGMSGFTLTRFYSIHTLLLPSLLVVFMAVHIYLIRLHNLSDPGERIAGEKVPPLANAKPYRFFPEHMFRTSLAFAVLFTVLLVLAVQIPAPMEEKAGTVIADYLPRPEWYYMWVFQLLTYFTGVWEAVGSLLIPVGGVLLMLCVPFMSESRMKGFSRRPVSMTIGLTFIVCVVYLTSQAYSEARPYNQEVMVPSVALTAEQQQGLRIYVERECAYCHNIQGRGGHKTGPDLSNMVAKRRTAQYLSEYIKKPVSKMASSTMPDYDLTTAELNAVSAFLLSLNFKNGVHPVAMDTQQVRKTIPNTLPKE